MAKVLVTGATGFVGSHLTRRLLDDGHEVSILVRPTSNYYRPELAGAQVCTGDVTDRSSVYKAVYGVDTVYHLAAIFRKAKFPDSVYWDTNYGGTYNILEACADSGVRRLVHCSTVGVLGHIQNPPADETAPYSPGDVYQRSKCEAEQEVLNFNKTGKLSAVVIRPAGVYGPGDTRWLKLFKSIAHKRFAMLGSGKTFIHMVYISDLVNAFLLAAESPNAPGRVYIAGDERYVTLNEVASTIANAVGVRTPWAHFPVGPVRFASGICEDICRALGVEPPIFRRRVDFFVKSRAFDISRAKSELGYSPKVHLDEGVSQTAAWYKEHGLI